MDKHGKKKTNISGKPNIPLAHSIRGTIYRPVGIFGRFEAQHGTN